MYNATKKIEILEAQIKLLEKENEELKAELAEVKSHKASGRKKHNAAWMASYNNFVSKYKSGMSVSDIAKENKISIRTAYRYKAYFEESKEENYNDK